MTAPGRDPGRPATATEAPGPVRPAGRRVIPAWVAAQVVGLTGTRLINVAIPWFVLVTTSDPALAGAVGLAQMAPLVLAKAASGPAIDRVGPVRLAVAADLASCAAVAVVPLLHAAGHLGLPVLFVAVAVEGALRGPGDAAKYALCPRIAAATRRPLARITGYANTVDRLAGAVGAAVGGLVVAAVGAPVALWVSCGTFVTSALLLRGGLGSAFAARPPGGAPSEPGPTERGGPRSYLRSLVGGWRFLRRDQVLLAITLMIAAANLLDQAYATILVPTWALAGGRGPEAVGLVFAVFTGSAVAGSLAAGCWGARLPTLPTYVVAFVLAGLPRYAVLALDPPPAVALGVLVVGGLASGFINPLVGAVVFGRIPDAIVGRVTALNTALAWALVPFGGLAGGLLVARIGAAAALWATGLTYLAVTLAPLVVPAFRRLDDGRSTAPEDLVSKSSVQVSGPN